MHAVKVLASSSFVAVNKRRFPVMLLPSGGRENANLGRLEEAEDGSAVEKGELASDKFERTPRGCRTVFGGLEASSSGVLKHTENVLKHAEESKDHEAYKMMLSTTRVRSRHESGPQNVNAAGFEHD